MIDREFQANLRQFLRDDASGYWTWLPLETKIVEESLKTYATLPKKIFFRTADCLHLVTALHHGFDQICTHDVHQLRAAQALGLQAVTIQ